MSTDPTPRDAVLRRLLVATVDTGSSPSRPRWMLAAASIGAFAVAGALTGGALASAATNGQPTTDYPPFEISAPPILDDDVAILGTPFVLTGRDPGSLDLGTAPDSADGLAIAIYCLEYGSYEVALDDEFAVGAQCTEEPGSAGPGGGGGTIVALSGEPPRTLSVDLEPGGGYAVWAAWVDQPEPAVVSAEQAEALADGVVTREEYVAGFERYVACMADLGFEVYGGDPTNEIIGYSIEGSAGDSGAANRCYDAEFHLVDMEWQVAHAD